MELREELSHKTLVIPTKDPYAAALELMERCAGHGRITVTSNHLVTTGPHTRATVIFTIGRRVDAFSETSLLVDCYGDITLKRLTVRITGQIKISIPTTGKFGNQVFEDFYLSKIWPRSRAFGKKMLSELLEVVTEYTKSLAYKAI
jgi:hypothetical protein